MSSAHLPSVAPVETSSVGHFERGGRHFEGTRAQRAQDVWPLPTMIVGYEMANDSVFMRLADEAGGNLELARVLARVYVRRGPGLKAFAAMLVKASPIDDSPVRPVNRLMNMGKRDRYVGSPPKDDDPTYAVQQRYIATLERGTRLLRLRGYRRCLECWAPLAADNRRLYCSAHEGSVWGGRDRDAMTTTLRALAVQLGYDSDGPQRRRVKRRIPPR